MKTTIFIWTLPLLISACTSSPSDTDGNPCGAVNARIINGQDCKRTNLTPIALVVLEDKDGEPLGQCSGTLISGNSVLTAAHCIVDDEEDEDNQIVSATVILGSVFMQSFDLRAHPRYSPSELPSAFDVAIIKLPASISGIVPVPLTISRYAEVDDEVVVYGGGVKNEEGEASFDGENISYKAANLVVAAHEPPFIYTTNEGTGAAVCQGDSGGPLLLPVGDTYGVVGVTSAGFGRPGCIDDQIAAFVDVQTDANRDFILNNAPDAAVQ